MISATSLGGYASFGNLGLTDQGGDVLTHARVPRPSQIGAVKTFPNLRTVTDAKAYASAGYHASVDKGDAAESRGRTAAALKWASAANLYEAAFRIPEQNPGLGQDATFSGMLSTINAANAVADAAKVLDGGGSTDAADNAQATRLTTGGAAATAVSDAARSERTGDAATASRARDTATRLHRRVRHEGLSTNAKLGIAAAGIAAAGAVAMVLTSPKKGKSRRKR